MNNGGHMKIGDLVKCKLTGEIGVIAELALSIFGEKSKPALRVFFSNTDESEWLFSHEIEVIHV